MQYFSNYKFFHIIYAFSLVCFLILFYFKIQSIFLTNFIIIISLTLLIIKLIYWYSINKNKSGQESVDKIKFFMLKLIYCIFTYINPIYYLMQDSKLVINHYVSSINFTIVAILAIIGIFIERRIFLKESQQNV